MIRHIDGYTHERVGAWYREHEPKDEGSAALLEAIVDQVWMLQPENVARLNDYLLTLLNAELGRGLQDSEGKIDWSAVESHDEAVQAVEDVAEGKVG